MTLGEALGDLQQGGGEFEGLRSGRRAVNGKGGRGGQRREQDCQGAGEPGSGHEAPPGIRKGNTNPGYTLCGRRVPPGPRNQRACLPRRDKQARRSITGEAGGEPYFPQQSPALAQHSLPWEQHAFTSLLAPSFLASLPQQALDSSQHLAPSLQQSWAPAQQPLSLAQHSMPLSQQPSFFAASQQALSLAQQAAFSLQQSPFSALSAAPAANTRPSDRISPATIFNMVNLE